MIILSIIVLGKNCLSIYKARDKIVRLKGIMTNKSIPKDSSLRVSMMSLFTLRSPKIVTIDLHLHT